ncbi:hypothetical protein HK096_005183, partial [Nowakowskiella sp. JEL0078]
MASMSLSFKVGSFFGKLKRVNSMRKRSSFLLDSDAVSKIVDGDLVGSQMLEMVESLKIDLTNDHIIKINKIEDPLVIVRKTFGLYRNLGRLSITGYSATCASTSFSSWVDGIEITTLWNLKLKSMKLEGNDVVLLAKIIGSNTNLRVLCLEDVYSQDLSQLVKPLNCINITEIQLINAHIGKNGFEVFADSLTGKRIASLKICKGCYDESTALGIAHLIRVCGSGSSLSNLDLSEIQFLRNSSNVAKALAEALKEITTIRFLTLKMDFSNLIDENVATLLESFLPSAPVIQSMFLESISFGQNALNTLNTFFEKSSSLEHLSLSKCNSTVIPSLKELFKNNHSIRTLNLSSIPKLSEQDLFDALLETSTLTSLNLSE